MYALSESNRIISYVNFVIAQGEVSNVTNSDYC